MNFLKSRSSQIFISGGLFGFFLTNFWTLSEKLPSFLYRLLLLPFLGGWYISKIVLWPICKLSKTNICRGLGFDGGPLEWIEWLFVYTSMIICYGLVFLSVYKIYSKLKK